MTTPLNFPNIQGDIILGLPKKVEEYVFFQITNPSLFRIQFKAVVPFITTTQQVIDNLDAINKNKKAGTNLPLLKLPGTNVAFTRTGIQKVGITADLGDPQFDQGQLANANTLGDSGTTDANGNFVPDWDATFKQQLDGVFLITAESDITLAATHLALQTILVGSITIVDTLKGNVRPGPEKGHEHFGFLDCISQPAITGFGTPNPGQESVDAGVILLGNDGDNPSRTAIAKDGSFLAFRKLKQYVPEFDAFLLKNGVSLDVTPEQGATLLGARLMGRWKSGAPIDITPLVDNPAIGDDPQQNNNFHYIFTNPDDQTDQTRCPFAAHLRKTNPRGDLDKFGGTSLRRIIRHGIPYGPEVSPSEESSHTTTRERGLAFVAYQSVIGNGFQFIQHSWADSPTFPPGKNVNAGFDPIIGQDNGGSRSMIGTNPNSQSTSLPLTTTFVESRGGEYFFSPSISTLRDVIAAQ